MKLSPRQTQVLDCIATHIRDQGYPPTIRDIGAALGIKSTNAVNDHLAALEKKGAIARERSRSRSITIIEQESALDPVPRPIQVPVLGRIAAGAPLLAEENVLEHVTVDPGYIPRSSTVFGLRVVGDSMIDDGIHEDDVILVRQQDAADNGQIVVALVDGEATVKRFFKESHRIRLQPANDEMDPIYVSAADARDTLIQGVVVAVFRKL
jgi:repressor LexA